MCAAAPLAKLRPMGKGRASCARAVVPLHLDARGEEAADAPALLGRQRHPNKLVLLSKRRRVTEWDSLGLDPMEESPSLLTSGDDSGGSGESSFESDTSSGEESWNESVSGCK